MAKKVITTENDMKDITDEIRRQAKIEADVAGLVGGQENISKRLDAMISGQEEYHKRLDEKLNPVIARIESKANRNFYIYSSLIVVVFSAILFYKVNDGTDRLQHKDFAQRTKLNKAADWMKSIDTDKHRAELFYEIVNQPAATITTADNVSGCYQKKHYNNPQNSPKNIYNENKRYNLCQENKPQIARNIKTTILPHKSNQPAPKPLIKQFSEAMKPNNFDFKNKAIFVWNWQKFTKDNL